MYLIFITPTLALALAFIAVENEAVVVGEAMDYAVVLAKEVDVYEVDFFSRGGPVEAPFVLVFRVDGCLSFFSGRWCWKTNCGCNLGRERSSNRRGPLPRSHSVVFLHFHRRSLRRLGSMKREIEKDDDFCFRTKSCKMWV